MANPGTILVTGASSGIGRDAALHLNAEGYTVIGTVRTPGDAESLCDDAARQGAMHAIHCDVTSDADVAHLADQVRIIAGDTGLTAMFSNAGVANMSGDVTAEGCPVHTLARLMEINYLGSVRVIQAHLPLLRASTGTLVINSALMARTVMPYNGGYAASKAALEAWADQLRREIRPHGVRVVCIRAAAIATPLETKQNAASVPADGPYPEQHAFVEGGLTLMRRSAAKTTVQPRRVSELVQTVIERRRPPLKPIVGGMARPIWLLGGLPERIQDAVIAQMITRMVRAGDSPPATDRTIVTP
ncbi:MAG: SDR family NAD(P)-dependent oxidoreductase [Thermoleophilia bacterium]|nr:SDR family NAD(P)-dependent oxidoreductase [Thermoleophilia bacterium]